MGTRVERARKRRQKALRTIAIAIILSTITLSATGYIYASRLLEKEVIYSGISINGVDVGNMTKEQAEKELARSCEEALKGKKLVLRHENYSKEISYGEIGAGYDYEASVEKAFELGRSGGFFGRIGSIIKARGGDVELSMSIKRDESRMEEILQSIKSDIEREPVDATIDVSSGEILVAKEQNGQTVDMELLSKRVDESIGSAGEVQIPVELEIPQTTSKDLEGIKREIGQYSTSFSSGDQGRNHNILLSSEAIDGKIVMPGETFSFNESTGLRDRANGYKESIIIVNKKPVPGVGGGVCQTSSTLYNAIANTGIEIVERHNHSLPVGYVPRGMDATVSDNTLDFRFRNSFDYPIFIKSDIVGNTVQIRIYGK